MKLKILSVFITLVLSLGLLLSITSVAYAYDESSYQYEINNMRIRHVRSSSSTNNTPGIAMIVVLLVLGGGAAIKALYEHTKDDNAAERKLREAELKISQNELNNSGEPKNFTEQIAGEIRKKDGNFSGDKFIWLVENFFIAYMDTYSQRNIKLLEELTTEDIFFDDKKALEEHIEKGTAHIRERINFQTDYLYRYDFNDKHEYASVYIKAKMIDYVEDINTGDSIHGSKSKESFCFYSITLRRKLGDKTIIEEGVTSYQCPNCGSNIDAVVAGKCKFCGETVKTTKSTWRISSVRKTNIGTDLGESGIFRIS